MDPQFSIKFYDYLNHEDKTHLKKVFNKIKKPQKGRYALSEKDQITALAKTMLDKYNQLKFTDESELIKLFTQAIETLIKSRNRFQNKIASELLTKIFINEDKRLNDDSKIKLINTLAKSNNKKIHKQAVDLIEKVTIKKHRKQTDKKELTNEDLKIHKEAILTAYDKQLEKRTKSRLTIGINILAISAALVVGNIFFAIPLITLAAISIPIGIGYYWHKKQIASELIKEIPEIKIPVTVDVSTGTIQEKEGTTQENIAEKLSAKEKPKEPRQFVIAGVNVDLTEKVKSKKKQTEYPTDPSSGA